MTLAADWSMLSWRDSAWSFPVFGGLSVGGYSLPVLSLTPQEFMFWLSGNVDPSGYGRMLFSEIVTDGFSAPETVMVTTTSDAEYSAAVSPRGRWAARSDVVPGQGVFRVRVAYSESVGVWRELLQQGVDETGCSIAPLSDTSAMLSFSGKSGLAWVLFERDRMARAGYLDTRQYVPLHPRFRFRPSGGLWLMWTESRWVHVSSFRDGEWVRGDSLSARHPDGQTFVSSWCDASRDGAERPVLAWGDLGYAYTYRDVGCVAFPTEDGWSEGEEVPGSDGLFTSPTVTRDRNGDAWLAWDLLRRDGVLFTHTYVSATASVPKVLGAGRHRSVAWTLSAPAPESWWAVLRARGNDPFEEVARVRAGPGTEMSWADESPPAGVLRYKVRRESVDRRYEWLSEEATWPPHSMKPRPTLQLASPVWASAEIEVSDAAAGALELRVYDVQGRLVHKQSELATGSGAERFRLDLGMQSRGLSSGIYFVRARDAQGSETAAVKFVRLR